MGDEVTMRTFKIPTKAYYEVLMPDGSRHTLLLKIGKEYTQEELYKIINRKGKS